MKNRLAVLIAILLVGSAVNVIVADATNQTITPSVNVPQGGNIQTAIDQVSASGGGSVILSKGTYSISSPLRIKSNVKLFGAGRGATIISNGGGEFNVIYRDSEGLSNVTIANLTVVGAHTTNCCGILIDTQVLSLIYVSGVSTSPIMTDISGHGLGLAIVQEKVEKLHGSLTVETVPDAGTTFLILLPLTLANFRGILIRVDYHFYPTHR